MLKSLKIFRISGDERWVATVLLAFFGTLNVLVALSYSDLLAVNSLSHWDAASPIYSLSGYDDCLYRVLTRWNAISFNTFRHPLLAVFLLPLALLNMSILAITDYNLAAWLSAAVVVVCDVYAGVFLYRLLRTVIKVCRLDAFLLTLLLFSFASVMIAGCQSDHFAMSLFLLLLFVYIIGVRLKHHRSLSPWQVVVMTFVGGGVTTTHMVKVFLADMLMRGRRFFRPWNILRMWIIPVMLFAILYKVEVETIIKPQDRARAERIENTIANDASFRKHQQQAAARQQERRSKQLVDSKYFDWSDMTVPRMPVVIENVFGESLLFHSDYCLMDVNKGRPVVVSYRSALPYVVETVVVALFVLGVWYGRRQRLMQILLSWFAFDMFLHLFLGFGILEVYIMGSHWLFTIPVAVAYVLKGIHDGRVLCVLRILLECVLIYYMAANALSITGAIS